MEKKNVTNMAGSLFVGWSIGMLLLLVGTAFLSYLIAGNKLDDNVQPYGITVLILTASAIGSALSMRRKKHIATAAIFASVFWLGLLAITILFFEGPFQGVAATLLVIAGGSIVPLLLRIKKGKHYRGRQVFARYR